MSVQPALWVAFACVLAVSLLSLGNADAAAPGNGSLPERRPDYIRLGPKPTHPEDALIQRHHVNSHCPDAPGQLVLVNRNQSRYWLDVQISRYRVPGSTQDIRLKPGSRRVLAVCDVMPGRVGHWQSLDIRFVAPH